jgi:hypothetical protein
MTVRKALGESGWAQRCIQTIHWRRYCFVEDVLPLKRLTTHSKNPGCFDACTCFCTDLVFFVITLVGEGVAVGEGAIVSVGVGILVGIHGALAFLLVIALGFGWANESVAAYWLEL